MIRPPRSFLILSTMLTLFCGTASAQVRHYPLESSAGLNLINATAEPMTLEGKKGLRVVAAEEARTRLARREMVVNPLVVVDGLEFGDGTIEAEMAGELTPGAGEAQRGFVGIVFRLQKDLRTFDRFFLRPTNGRADDQVRRNHAVGYTSQPEWPFDRLRKETPSRYEAYVDLVPGVWTKVRVVVRGAQARLYVHDQEQPTLIVNDVKSGARATGGVAFGLSAETIAHFRNLRITLAKTGDSR